MFFALTPAAHPTGMEETMGQPGEASPNLQTEQANRPKGAPAQHSPRQPKTDQDQIVNDSLGTVDPADSTGSDETKETGDAKRRNANTRED